MLRLLKINKRDKDGDQNTVTYIKKVLFLKKSLKVGRQNNIIVWQVTQIAMLLHTQRIS